MKYAALAMMFVLSLALLGHAQGSPENAKAGQDSVLAATAARATHVVVDYSKNPDVGPALDRLMDALLSLQNQKRKVNLELLGIKRDLSWNINYLRAHYPHQPVQSDDEILKAAENLVDPFGGEALQLQKIQGIVSQKAQKQEEINLIEGDIKEINSRIESLLQKVRK